MPLHCSWKASSTATLENSMAIFNNFKYTHSIVVLVTVSDSCNTTDCNPSGSSVQGISQARVLEWVAISCSRGSSPPSDETRVSCLAGGFFTTEPPGKHAAAKSLQSCPTLCDPIDSSPPGSPVPGILQARILEWVAISFSNA